MKFSKSIHAVDTHTVGQATRIIVSGVPALRGNSMMEKKHYLETHYDYIRRATMLEPRGHADMFGAVLTEPVSNEADVGVIFIDGVNYLNMCGHGTIGVATMLIETGMVEGKEPYTDIIMEAPAGLIRVRVLVEDGKAKEVSFINVPAFVYEHDKVVTVPGIGTIQFDIAFGGSFFAIVKDSELGVTISTDTTEETVPKAVAFLDYIHENVTVQHPELPIDRIELVEIYGKPDDDEADCKNMVVLGRGEIDRSPCGTGTCAKLALLHSKKALEIGEKFIHESIIGTKFCGEIVDTALVGNYPGVIPKITGKAFITGFNHFVIDEDDPVKYGFRIRK